MNAGGLPPGSLRDKCIVVTNDDGIDAPGITVLADAARVHSDDVWVVAPAKDQSARGRAMSHKQDVEVEARQDRGFAVNGTPVDCVMIALNGLLGDRHVDLVLSGVNRGANLADEIHYSGTVGACMEGAEQGVPGIAFSAHRGESAEVDWRLAERLAVDLLPVFAGGLGSKRMVLNVNFPSVSSSDDIRGMVATACGWRDSPTHIHERPAREGRRVFRIAPLRDDIPRHPRCDLDWLLKGYVTATPLGLDLTDRSQLDNIARALRYEQLASEWVTTGTRADPDRASG